MQLADRWHTCFYDLDGGQGMLGQVEGRTADDVAYWLAGATPAGRNAVRVVAIDMCTIYLSAVRRMLPHAQVAVDLFHVVQLAVKTVSDVRRRAIREKYGRRGKAGDPEYQGSADRWRIGIYLASTSQYTESELPTSFGPKTGTPEEGVDDTFVLYAGPKTGR